MYWKHILKKCAQITYRPLLDQSIEYSCLSKNKCPFGKTDSALSLLLYQDPDLQIA